MKWKTKRRWRLSQARTLGFMGRIVVEDDVNQLPGRHLCLDGVKEADELLMALALHATTDDPAFEHASFGIRLWSRLSDQIH